MSGHHSGIEVPPTRERFRQGGVALVPDHIVVTDDDGQAIERTIPYRAKDIIDSLLEHGVIKEPEFKAARDFHQAFHRAQLDPRAAIDWARPYIRPTWRDRVSSTALDARKEVLDALRPVGGIWSDGGSCLWHVIGWERTIKEWASRCAWRASGRPINRQEARGILVTALGVLAVYYEV